MKLFKNLFLILALCAIDSLSARMGGSPVVRQQPPVEVPQAPQAPQGFKKALDDIKKTNANSIINADGVFKASFTEAIRGFDLEPEFMRALLEAGRNLHMPLDGDTAIDLNRIAASNREIMRFMDQNAPGQTPAPGSKILNLTAAEKMFYDPTTNIFKTEFLNKKIQQLIPNGLKQADAEASLLQELMPLMVNVWKKNGISISKERVENAREQIISLIAEDYRKWSIPSKQTEMEWYDGWGTHLIKQEYLNNFIREAINQNKSKQLYQKELEKLEKQVIAKWEEEGIKAWDKVKLRQQLNKQLKETAEKIESKIMSAWESPNPNIEVGENDWYNGWETHLLNEEFLKNEVMNLSNSKLNAGQKKHALISRFLPQLQEQWNKEGVDRSGKKTLADKAIKQINEAVDSFGSQPAPQPQPIANITKLDFYDEQTHLLVQNKLEEKLSLLLKSMSKDAAASLIYESIEKPLEKKWRDEQKTDQQIGDYFAKIEQQIRETAEKLKP